MNKSQNTNFDSRAAFTNMLLYQFLLIATPFLLVRNFLQQAIGNLSQLSFSLGSLDIPYILFALLVLLIIVAVVNIRRLSLKTLVIFAFIILLMGIGQSVTDYYFNHDFYELQHNWHYFAYGIFAWISYLYHRQRGASLVRYIWQTVAMGQFISIIDEVAQIFISGRVFDICDVGKDLWGLVTGLIAVCIAVYKPDLSRVNRFLYKKIKDNFTNVWSSLLLLFIYSFLFLTIGSVLSENRYLLPVFSWTISSFLLVTALLYLMQYKKSRIIVLALVVIIGTWILIDINTGSRKIINKKPGLLTYRGVAVPYFDLMIKTDGSIKIVDKKMYFNKKDKINRIYGLCEDILLIGSGSRGQGGKGFDKLNSQFVFNPVTRKPLQILIYPNAQACSIYNKLISDGKKPLLIIHNS